MYVCVCVCVGVGVALGWPIVAICPICPVETQPTGKPQIAGKLPKFWNLDTISPKCGFSQFKYSNQGICNCNSLSISGLDVWFIFYVGCKIVDSFVTKAKRLGEQGNSELWSILKNLSSWRCSPKTFILCPYQIPFKSYGWKCFVFVILIKIPSKIQNHERKYKYPSK